VTLDWQIGAIIGVTGIVFTVIFFYLSRREKVEIKYANMQVQLRPVNNGMMDKEAKTKWGRNQLEISEASGIHIECSFSLLYAKGMRDRYISEIWLEFDKHLWKKLKPYFEVYLRVGKASQGELPKLELGKPQLLGIDAWFPARRTFTEEEHKELDDIVQKLLHRYKIGWRDTYGKTQWKTIHQLREIRNMLYSGRAKRLELFRKRIFWKL